MFSQKEHMDRISENAVVTTPVDHQALFRGHMDRARVEKAEIKE